MASHEAPIVKKKKKKIKNSSIEQKNHSDKKHKPKQKKQFKLKIFGKKMGKTIILNLLISLTLLFQVSNALTMVSISNCTALKKILTNVSGYCFYLTQDIDCTSIVFPPIGSAAYPFKSIFDGKNRLYKKNTLLFNGKKQNNTKKDTINNLLINYSGSSDVGLFAVTSGATIQNVNVQNFTLTASTANVGILVGSAIQLTTIQNCHVSGTTSSPSTVTSSTCVVGGLIGMLSNSVISGCTIRNAIVKTTGGISGAPVGGIVGKSCTNSLVTNCHNYGTNFHFFFFL